MKRLLVALCLLLAFGQVEARLIARGPRSADMGSSNQAMSWTAPVYDSGVGAAAISGCSYFTLKGYRTSGGSLAYFRSTSDCSTLTLTATGIAAGVWYWAVTATDSAGNESDPTPEETNTVP